MTTPVQPAEPKGLPPLPVENIKVDAFGDVTATDRRAFVSGGFYTADQMHDYAILAMKGAQQAPALEERCAACSGFGTVYFGDGATETVCVECDGTGKVATPLQAPPERNCSLCGGTDPCNCKAILAEVLTQAPPAQPEPLLSDAEIDNEHDRQNGMHGPLNTYTAGRRFARAIEAAVIAKQAPTDDPSDALEKVRSWAQAYPLDVFPEPDWMRSNEVLEAAGLSLSRISAANMRHVITRVLPWAEALAKQAASPESMGVWQDIATAPKDGVLSLFCDMRALELRHVFFVDWMVSGAFCGNRHHTATHWMPLPAAPTTTGVKP